MEKIYYYVLQKYLNNIQILKVKELNYIKFGYPNEKLFKNHLDFLLNVIYIGKIKVI